MPCGKIMQKEKKIEGKKTCLWLTRIALRFWVDEDDDDQEEARTLVDADDEEDGTLDWRISLQGKKSPPKKKTKKNVNLTQKSSFSFKNVQYFHISLAIEQRILNKFLKQELNIRLWGHKRSTEASSSKEMSVFPHFLGQRTTHIKKKSQFKKKNLLEHIRDQQKLQA